MTLTAQLQQRYQDGLHGALKCNPGLRPGEAQAEAFKHVAELLRMDREDAVDHLNNALQIAQGVESDLETMTVGELVEMVEGMRSRVQLAKLALEPHQGSRREPLVHVPRVGNGRCVAACDATLVVPSKLPTVDAITCPLCRALTV